MAEDAEKTLFERFGGIYPIAAVVNRFSDRLLENPKIVHSNPELEEWHTEEYKTRLPGLKFMRALWVADVTGGPFKYTGKSLEEAHFRFHIPPEVFDEVAMELSNAMDEFKVPEKEKTEVMTAFNAQKPDVTAGAK